MCILLNQEKYDYQQQQQEEAKVVCIQQSFKKKTEKKKQKRSTSSTCWPLFLLLLLLASSSSCFLFFLLLVLFQNTEHNFEKAPLLLSVFPNSWRLLKKKSELWRKRLLRLLPISMKQLPTKIKGILIFLAPSSLREEILWMPCTNNYIYNKVSNYLHLLTPVFSTHITALKLGCLICFEKVLYNIISHLISPTCLLLSIK